MLSVDGASISFPSGPCTATELTLLDQQPSREASAYVCFGVTRRLSGEHDVRDQS